MDNKVKIVHMTGCHGVACVIGQGG